MPTGLHDEAARMHGPGPGSIRADTARPRVRDYPTDVPVYDDPVDGRALPSADLEAWTARLIERLGTPADIAADVAALLSASDRRGIASHGTARLPQYVSLVEAGVLDPAARPEVLRRRAAIALLDARNGWGHHASRVATDLAIDGAREAGSFTAVVRRSNHYGIAGLVRDPGGARPG